MDLAYDDESFGGAGDFAKLMNLFDDTEQEIENMRESGYQIAHFQQQYRMMVATKTLKLRANGTPVTVISDIVRGDPTIAKMKDKWMCAEADNKASSHLVFLNERKIDVLNDAIKREWYRPQNA